MARGRSTAKRDETEGGEHAASAASALPPEPGPLLRFTGHPLADVGVATVCAIVGKAAPEEVTLEDLDEVADEIERHYFGPAMVSYLSCVFMNAAYCPPNNKPSQMTKYREAVVRAHRAEPDPAVLGERCAYSGRRASFAAQRTHVPLLTADGQANFHPGGRTFLPLSGPYVVALQTLPLGSRRCEGRLLAVWSDDQALLRRFARRFLDDNRKYLALHMQSGRFPPTDLDGSVIPRGRAVLDSKTKAGKYPSARAATSLLVDELHVACAELADHQEERTAASVVAYWLSSSGQGASLEILPVPSALVRFLRRANARPHGEAWRRAVGRAWARVREGKGKAERASRKGKGAVAAQPSAPGGAGRSRNALLEELRAVLAGPRPDRMGAARFVRRHLLPRREAVRAGALEAAWPLVDLFLEEVLGMDRTRIAAIKQLADALAEYITATNDAQAFRSILRARREGELRGAVVRAQRREAERGRLLVDFEGFVNALVADDVLGRMPFQLARDLIAVRLVEQLHERGWFAAHEEALSDLEPDEGEQHESAGAAEDEGDDA